MAKGSKPDKGNQRKTPKTVTPKTDSERTQPLPKLQKVIDAHFTNWPSEDDNPEDGAK